MTTAIDVRENFQGTISMLRLSLTANRELILARAFHDIAWLGARQTGFEPWMTLSGWCESLQRLRHSAMQADPIAITPGLGRRRYGCESTSRACVPRWERDRLGSDM